MTGFCYSIGRVPETRPLFFQDLDLGLKDLGIRYEDGDMVRRMVTSPKELRDLSQEHDL